MTTWMIVSAANWLVKFSHVGAGSAEARKIGDQQRATWVQDTSHFGHRRVEIRDVDQ